jgi:hypothetical protein
MNKPTRRRRAACRAAARTLTVAAAMAALVATLGVGQAQAGPDERVLERQGRIDRQAADGQADEQGKAGEPAQSPSAQYPRRYLPPEPPMDTGPRLDTDEQLFPAPPPAPDRDRDGLGGVVISLAVAALLLAAGAAITWRLRHRRPRPEPTT